MLFINLPVENLEKSMNFYTHLGFSNKPLFSDDHQKCMVWSEHIYVMLMTHEQFQTYSRKPIPDTNNHVAAYYTLSVNNVDRVNEMANNGLKAGGTEPIPMMKNNFMYLRKIEDFDGHTWDIMCMDLSKFKKE